MILTYWGQNVYNNCAVSNYSRAFLINLALLNLTNLYTNYRNSEILFNTLTGLSLVQFTGLVVYKLVSIAKHNRRVRAFIIAKFQRERAEEGMELFEIAAAERDRQ